MAAIFNAPMRADGMAECLGVEGGLAGVEGNFLSLAPEPGLCVLVPGQASNAGRADDQAVPVGIELAADVEGFDQAMLLAAMVLAVDGLEAVSRRPGDGDVLKCGQQARLVGLDLGEQRVAAVLGGLKGFFGSAERRR